MLEPLIFAPVETSQNSTGEGFLLASPILASSLAGRFFFGGDFDGVK